MESKLLNTKKAQIGKKINGAVAVIITVVVLFLVFADLVPEAQSAGDSFGDAQLCSESGGFFNTSQSACLNGTGVADTREVAFEDIPLNSLFSSTGVVIILLMVALLLIILKVVIPGRTKK